MPKDIFKHRESVTSSSLSGTSTSLRGTEGLMRQIYIKAGTNTTIFKVNIQDKDSDQIASWGYHTGELNELLALPVRGPLTISLTNLSQNDTFTVSLLVEK